MNFISIQHREGDIEKYYQYQAEKNKKINATYFISKGIYTGPMAEDDFEYLLKEERKQYQRITNEMGRDYCDFILDGRNIDVKSITSKYNPIGEYRVNVASIQVENDKVDTYVFSVFVEPKLLMVFVGWIDKNNFLKNATLYSKGYNMGNFKAPVEMYDIPIYYLNPLGNLFSTINKIPIDIV